MAGSFDPDGALVNMGNVVFCVGREPPAQARAEAYGGEWVHRYKKAWAKHPD